MGHITKFKKIEKRDFVKLLKTVLEVDDDTFNIMKEGANQRSERIGVALSDNLKIEVHIIINSEDRYGVPDKPKKVLNDLMA